MLRLIVNKIYTAFVIIITCPCYNEQKVKVLITKKHRSEREKKSKLEELITKYSGHGKEVTIDSKRYIITHNKIV